jgi:hypothetical protein
LPNPYFSTLRAADGRLPSLPRLPLDQPADAQRRREDRAGREPRKGTSERALFVLDVDHVISWSFLSPIGVSPGVDGARRAAQALS